jgi:hypothetical protein
VADLPTNGGPHPAGQQRLVPGQNVAFGPLTTVVSILTLPNGQKVVQLRAETTVGTIVHLLELDHAESLAEKLSLMAKQARTGLTVVPNSPLITPPRDGPGVP